MMSVRNFLCLSILVVAAQAHAETELGLLGGVYDLVAPSIPGNPTQPVVGQIYFDSSAQQFKGVNTSGAFVALSAPSGSAAVTSSGSQERIERARIAASVAAPVSPCSAANCAISRQSGNWLSSVSWSATGTSLAIQTGIFSAPPTCVVYPVFGSAVLTFQDGGDNTSTSIPKIRFTSAASPTTTVDAAFDIICMGPR